MNEAWLDEYLQANPYADILADIIGHPEGAPSIEELAYMNPDLMEESIQQHITRLLDIGVVEEFSTPPQYRDPDHPRKFYALTDNARPLLTEIDAVPEVAWTRQYAAVQKTDRIETLENIPRPE